jgi:hypothetical protein
MIGPLSIVPTEATLEIVDPILGCLHGNAKFFNFGHAHRVSLLKAASIYSRAIPVRLSEINLRTSLGCSPPMPSRAHTVGFGS